MIDQTVSPTFSIHPDIVYATHDRTEMCGDLYLPAGPGPFPAVIMIPGGAWMVSLRSGHQYWGKYLAAQGIAVFVIQYRVAVHEKMFPEAVCDVVSGIQFLRGSADEFNLDPDRIGMIGSSAGGHLGALAALAGDQPLFQSARPANAYSAVSPSVKAFAGIYGAYDLFAAWQDEMADSTPTNGGRVQCFLGAAPFEDRQLYFDASPISHVRYSNNKIPILLSYGMEDDLVRPQTQTEPFRRALRQAGFNVVSFPIVGAGHFWFSDEPIEEPSSFSGFLAPRLLRFLRRCV